MTEMKTEATIAVLITEKIVAATTETIAEMMTAAVTEEMTATTETIAMTEMVIAIAVPDLENAVPEENAMILKSKKMMYYCQ